MQFKGFESVNFWISFYNLLMRSIFVYNEADKVAWLPEILESNSDVLLDQAPSTLL